MSRKESSIYNLFFGILGNIVTTIVAIIIPRLFILNYGSEVNGLLQTIRQIYVYLALLEAGVGDASVLALYGPIARNEKNKVNSILAATNYYYKRIGIIYLAGVIALGFLFPLTLNTDIPYMVICAIILLQGMGGVINYLVQGKYNMLLRVDNRSYVTMNLGTVTSVLVDISRVLLLLAGQSIVIIQATYLFFNLIKMFFISWYMKKNYSWIDLGVKPDLGALSQKNSVIVHQISALVFSNTDVLILTYVCGLKVVSVYSLYASFYAMVNNVITIIANSVNAALGQVFNSDMEKYRELQEAYETYYLALVFSLFSILTIFMLPFMQLYTAGSDINYVDKWIPILFTTYQLLNYGRNASSQIIGFAGHFNETKGRAVIEASINIVVSLTCVFRFGIYGVLIGTIAALLYRANDMIIYANVKIMHRSPWPTYRRWLINLGLLVGCVWGFSELHLRMDSYLLLVQKGIVIGIIVMAIFFIVNSLTEKKSREIAQSYLKEIWKMRR